MLGIFIDTFGNEKLTNKVMSKQSAISNDENTF